MHDDHFSNYIDNFLEMFMDDFFVFDSSFDVCLANLPTVLDVKK